MRNLFNKSFFKFTFGFITILIVSFALAALVAHLDAADSQVAGTTQGR
jgi:hypothetical protein